MAVSESLASQILARCGRRCCVCRRFAPLHLQVHHIVERSEGGSDDVDNLIALCLTCHSDVHTKTLFTRRFTFRELKEHRNTLYQLVADGKLPGEATDPEPVEVLIARHGVPSSHRDSSLSNEAAEILVAAAFGNGYVLARKCQSGLAVIAGGKTLLDTDVPRDQARYKYAVDQLLGEGLIEPRGVKGEVYFVSHPGFLLADELAASASSASSPP